MPGKTYISPGLKPFAVGGIDDERVRIASKVIEADEVYAFADIKGEKIIRLTKSGKTNITAKFFETDRRSMSCTSVRGSSCSMRRMNIQVEIPAQNAEKKNSASLKQLFTLRKSVIPSGFTEETHVG